MALKRVAALVVVVGCLLAAGGVTSASVKTPSTDGGRLVALSVDVDHSSIFHVSDRPDVVARAAELSASEVANIRLAAGLLPGVSRHEGALRELMAAGLADIDTIDSRAPRDGGAYAAVVMTTGMKLVPAVEVDPGLGPVPTLPAEFGFTIEREDLFEIGSPLYKRSNCYRKASWSGFGHDICFWKYRIDENSASYDYWLYGNELTATSTKSHRGKKDPWIGWAKVAQQLGFAERRDYMTYGRFDTVKAHAPRGTETASPCTTTTFSTSLSASAANGAGPSGTVGVAHPISYCNRITEYMGFTTSYKRATYVWKRGRLGLSNRKKSAEVTTQTILKLKQRPHDSWQPFWSDTAQTLMRNWNWSGSSRMFD